MDVLTEFCDRFNLTPRQRSIFTMLVSGLSPKEIACRLSVSHVTIRRHSGEMYRRCGTRNSRETLAMFVRSTWNRNGAAGSDTAAVTH
jgi:DNA-binding NarL/FixJ family response regulator